jgi:hypothetical protein
MVQGKKGDLQVPLHLAPCALRPFIHIRRSNNFWEI